MPNPKRAVVLCLLLALGNSLTAQTSFIYHGTLQETGRPASGLHDFKFALAGSRDGSLVSGFLTNQAVAVSNGVFSVKLDFGDAVFDGSQRWLEIGVRRSGVHADFSSLTPRQELLPVPGAIHARKADVAVELEDGGAMLWNIPANSLFGRIPPEKLGGITSRQMDPQTDALYQRTETNVVQALIRSTTGQGRISPFEFGAVGDGKADDTAALQAWLDAAQQLNVIAELPAAPEFYRISDTLQVKGMGGLTLIGAGGQSHITGGPPYTRSRIHQVTPGKHGLVITNISGTVTPTDNVFLQGFMVTAEHYSPSSMGIGFVGGLPDTDVNVIMNVAAKNFGSGLFNGSACNLSVISCSFSYCGDGIQINGPIVNSVLIQSTICTGNRSNGLHVVSGKNVTFDTGDLVTWRSDRAHLATIEGGLVSLRNINGEHGSPVEAIRVVSHRPDTHLILDSGMILPFGPPAERTYSLSISNAGSVTIHNAHLHARATDGFAIIEYQSPPTAVSLRPYAEKIVVGDTVRTNWIGGYFRTFLPGLGGSSPGQVSNYGRVSHSGLFSVLNRPGDTELLFSADLSRYLGGTHAVHVPLLQYAKDKLTDMTVSNLSISGTVQHAGWGTGSFANYPGLITRVEYRDGGISGVRYEAWDAEAVDYAERAGIKADQLETAAVDQLVKRLKSAGLWDMADAIYLFRGGTAASCAQNLIQAENPIEWSTGPEPNFGRQGLTGNGSAFGLSSLRLSSADRFTSGNGSLFVYVGDPGAGPSFVAGARAPGAAVAIGVSTGLFGVAGNAGITNASYARGPLLLSMTGPNTWYLAGGSFTNSVSVAGLPLPDARFGVLAAAGASGEAVGPSSANLRALWIGAGLAPQQGRTLMMIVEEYLRMLGLAD